MLPGAADFFLLQILVDSLLKTVEFQSPIHRRRGDVRRVFAEPNSSCSSGVVL